MRYAFTLSAMLALAGCGFGPKVPPSLLNLTSAQTVNAGPTQTARAGEAITISVPYVPQALASNRIAVISGETAIAYVKDAQFVEPPAKLFQRLLSETVAAKTGRTVLDPRQFSFAPGQQLSGGLKAFGIDAQANEAVIVYDAAYSPDKGASVRTRRFEARVPVSEVEANVAGRALNEAANKVAGEVADWLAG